MTWNSLLTAFNYYLTKATEYNKGMWALSNALPNTFP